MQTQTNKKSPTKRFVLGFIVMFILSIIVQGYVVVTSVSDEEWEKYKCSYDIQYEFLFSGLITSYRFQLEKIGFDKNGIIISSMIKLDKLIYERVKKKIPKDDLMLATFWFSSELEPIISQEHIKSPSMYVPLMLEALKTFATQDSQIKMVNDYTRYTMGYYITTFFFHEDTLPILIKSYDQWLPEVITYTSILVDKMGDGSVLFNSENLRTGPFKIVTRAYQANYYYFRESKKVDCKSREIKNMEKYINQLLDFIPKYKTIKISTKEGTNFLMEGIEVFKNGYPDLKKFMKDKCNIDLKYETFNY
ncbi:hypothetical protein SZ25_00684 [Candidatus Arcanobacter lacustris]|uniref:Uncharacterized protein n=1 Tax=Candidatus Arcanibacter lacustris TaxID=1607817 RepID=A0A0F5MNU8_9RICK|nr:hypothetical protein SZ25_00684 [Candidatus Arcanobacter lacustris]